MSDAFEWKVEIAFKGTVTDFAKVNEVIQGQVKAGLLEIHYPDWYKPRPFPGIPPIDIRKLLGEDMIKEITADAQRISRASIRDIYGGIRDPHLHLGDEVVLLNKEKFRVFAMQVASQLAAHQVDMKEDFTAVMQGMNALAEM
jgi:hypothetical protein